MESCSSPDRPFHDIHFPAKEAVGRLNTQDCFLHRSRPIESGITSDTCIASGQSAAWLVLALSYMYRSSHLYHRLQGPCTFNASRHTSLAQGVWVAVELEASISMLPCSIARLECILLHKPPTNGVPALQSLRNPAQRNSPSAGRATQHSFPGCNHGEATMHSARWTELSSSSFAGHSIAASHLASSPRRTDMSTLVTAAHVEPYHALGLGGTCASALHSHQTGRFSFSCFQTLHI